MIDSPFLANMFSSFMAKRHKDLTNIFRSTLPTTPARGSIADNLTTVNVTDLGIGMIVVAFNDDHDNDWLKTTIKAYYQKTCDAPFIIEIIENEANDLKDFPTGFINLDSEEVITVWVLNQAIITGMLSSLEDTPIRKALKCEPIAPSPTLKAFASGNIRLGGGQRLAEANSGSLSSTGSGMLSHTQKEAQMFPALRALGNNESRLQAIRGNSDDILKDPATLVILANRIQKHNLHLPICSTGGLKTVIAFLARKESTIYTPATQAFSHCSFNMCLPWKETNVLTSIESSDQLVAAIQTLQEILEAIWEAQSQSIFGPWFTDLLDLFKSHSLIDGFRNLPIGIQNLSANQWLANMFSSFSMMNMRHYSMEGFNDVVRKQIKIDVSALHLDMDRASRVLRAHQPISSVGLSAAALGYAMSAGLSIDTGTDPYRHSNQKASSGNSTGGADSVTSHGGPRRKLKVTPAGKEKAANAHQQAAKVKKLEQQLANALAKPVGGANQIPAGNTAPNKDGVCMSRIAFILKINPTDCKKGYPECGRAHVDLPNPITDVSRATLRGYIARLSASDFKKSLEEKIAAL